MKLHEFLDAQRWFVRRSWKDDPFHPFAFRWDRERGKLIKAPVDDLHNQMITEYRFSPFEVMACDWDFVS